MQPPYFDRPTHLVKQSIGNLSAFIMFDKAFIFLFLATPPMLVLGQVSSCSTADICFSSGPQDVNFTQAALVVPNACVMLAGSYINDEQRHYCAVCTFAPSK